MEPLLGRVRAQMNALTDICRVGKAGFRRPFPLERLCVADVFWNGVQTRSGSLLLPWRSTPVQGGMMMCSQRHVTRCLVALAFLGSMGLATVATAQKVRQVNQGLLVLWL